MKAVTISFLICCLLASCKGHTQYGECIGIDRENQQPGLQYKVSIRNAIWSAIAIETVIAPVLWATDYAYCPVGKIEDKK